jgi:hypothetical protein
VEAVGVLEAGAYLRWDIHVGVGTKVGEKSGGKEKREDVDVERDGEEEEAEEAAEVKLKTEEIAAIAG